MTTDIRTLVGVHYDMDAAAYHALPGASASILRKLASSTPAHLRLYLDEPRKSTPAMMVGTLAHALALEPDKPLPLFVKKPETYPSDGVNKPWHGGANYCKAWEAEQVKAGYQVISAKDYNDAEGAAKALLAHEITGPVIRASAKEVTLITYDTSNDIGVRCRLDLVPPGPNLDDVKSTFSVAPHEFRRNAYASGFDIQAAMYLYVWNALCGAEGRKEGFRFFVVESEPPHDVRVFTCTPAFIAKGWEKVCRLLPVLAKCQREGAWPASPAVELPLDVPKWAEREEL
jgi:hypothetical protein